MIKPGKRIGQPAPADIKLKSIHEGRVLIVFSRKGGNLQRISSYEGRLNELRFRDLLEHFHDEIPIPSITIGLQALAPRKVLQPFQGADSGLVGTAMST